MHHKVCFTDPTMSTDGMDGLLSVEGFDTSLAEGVLLMTSFSAGDLAKAMRKIKIEGLTGELTWNDEGQVEKPATAYVIQDGKYIAA